MTPLYGENGVFPLGHTNPHECHLEDQVILFDDWSLGDPRDWVRRHVACLRLDPDLGSQMDQYPRRTPGFTWQVVWVETTSEHGCRRLGRVLILVPDPDCWAVAP